MHAANLLEVGTLLLISILTLEFRSFSLLSRDNDRIQILIKHFCFGIIISSAMLVFLSEANFQSHLTAQSTLLQIDNQRKNISESESLYQHGKVFFPNFLCLSSFCLLLFIKNVIFHSQIRIFDLHRNSDCKTNISSMHQIDSFELKAIKPQNAKKVTSIDNINDPNNSFDTELLIKIIDLKPQNQNSELKFPELENAHHKISDTLQPKKKSLSAIYFDMLTKKQQSFYVGLLILILLPSVFPLICFGVTRSSLAVFVALVAQAIISNSQIAEFLRYSEVRRDKQILLKFTVYFFYISLAFVGFAIDKRNIFLVSSVEAIGSGSFLYFAMMEIFGSLNGFNLSSCTEKVMKTGSYLIGILLTIFCKMI